MKNKIFVCSGGSRCEQDRTDGGDKFECVGSMCIRRGRGGRYFFLLETLVLTRPSGPSSLKVTTWKKVRFLGLAQIGPLCNAWIFKICDLSP